jgi:hypothetical protein
MRGMIENAKQNARDKEINKENKLDCKERSNARGPNYTIGYFQSKKG